METASLPDLYARWMDEFLERPIPAETRATCEECAMCDSSSESSSVHATFFDPQVKCCTYYPELPNFLVGGVLADEDPRMAAGRLAIEKRIASRTALTPIGLDTSPAEQVGYENLTQSGDFGRRPEARCPYYDDAGGGSCSIWKHRNSVCSTWFCKFDRGVVGQGFWKALKRLLGGIEQQLASWCALQLGISSDFFTSLAERADAKADPTASRSIMSGDAQLDGVLDDERYGRLWGEWAGREKEYFRRCAALVVDLTWADACAIAGVETAVAARLLREAYEKLVDGSTPKLVQIEPYRVLQSDEEGQRLETYSPFDPIDLPRQLIDLLPFFDGRSTEEVLEEIASEHEIEVAPELVRKLTDFRVLKGA